MGGATLDAGMRLLVAEDDRKVASFIRQGLEEEGHTVEVAADGAAALDLMVAGPPHDLVVLDLMLPKRDGFEVLKEMRQEKGKAPVLMLTAKDGVAYKVAGLDLGAVASASGRPVSESGRLRQGAGGHRRCARRRNGLMLPCMKPAGRVKSPLGHSLCI
jgi:CheY-like chemotaxis protein